MLIVVGALFPRSAASPRRRPHSHRRPGRACRLAGLGESPRQLHLHDVCGALPATTHRLASFMRSRRSLQDRVHFISVARPRSDSADPATTAGFTTSDATQCT